MVIRYNEYAFYIHYILVLPKGSFLSESLIGLKKVFIESLYWAESLNFPHDDKQNNQIFCSGQSLFES